MMRSPAVVHSFAGPCSWLSVASGLQYGGTRNQPENLVQEPDGAGLPCADGHQRHGQPGTCTTVTDWWNRCRHVKNLSCSPADLWSIFHSPVPTEWALLWDRRDLPLQLLPRDQGVLLTYIVFRDQNSLQTPLQLLSNRKIMPSQPLRRCLTMSCQPTWTPLQQTNSLPEYLSSCLVTTYKWLRGP